MESSRTARAMEHFPLRPLGIGEIFDRAITMYVRNFVVFTLIILTMLAPLAIVQFFALPNQGQNLSQLLDQIVHPSKGAASTPMTGGEVGLLIAAFLSLVLLAPVVNNAVAAGVAALYNGRMPDYRTAFGVALRRFGSLVSTAVLDLLIIAAMYFAGIIALAMVFTTGLLLARIALPLAVVFFALCVIGLLALILLLVAFLIAYAFATYAVSLESLSPVEAIGSSFRRLFNRKEFGKVLLMGLAYIALEIGVLLLSGAISILLDVFVKSYALELAVSSLMSAMLTAFITILLAVYYYDIRTRAEGLDLEVDLQRLAATS